MTEIWLAVGQGHRFVGGRGLAHKLRREAETRLEGHAAVVVFDFKGVEGVSHSFADELLSPLHDLLGPRVVDRVFLANVTDDVLEDLRLVAVMHELAFPGVHGADARTPA